MHFIEDMALPNYVCIYVGDEIMTVTGLAELFGVTHKREAAVHTSFMTK